MHVLLITYEFTYSPFSGNGILARSIVKSLLVHCNCYVTVWCCRPYEESHDHHIQVPEITNDLVDKLNVIATQLSKDDGWKQLDDQSAWRKFVWDDSISSLIGPINKYDTIMAVDWTGSYAYRSIIPNVIDIKPLVYLNFRVYSSGMAGESNTSRRQWHDDMEKKALQNASVVVVLSEKDKDTLQALLKVQSDDNNEISKPFYVLHPPLRGDMEDLALQPFENLLPDLPEKVRERINGNNNNQRRRCLITCVVRLSPEKQALRFVHLIEIMKDFIKENNYIPLLAGAHTEGSIYAEQVKTKLKHVYPECIIIDEFLSSRNLASIFSYTVLNIHPCTYDAYGMTIIEAAAIQVPSVISNSGNVGATAIISSYINMIMTDDKEHDISPSCVDKIKNALSNPEQLVEVGRTAQKQALAWDEAAYGKKLIEISIRHTTHCN